MHPLVASIPHSGEKIPSETPWLSELPETLLMYDVDRYVDQLYEPALHALKIPFVKTEWHRYAADLNRLPEDIDVDSVQGCANASGKFPRGFHWSITTAREKLMPGPMPKTVHEALVHRCYDPFHAELKSKMQAVRAAGQPAVYHIDLHSMPSKGTAEHRDPGEIRKDVVISDCDGKSCAAWFKDLVVDAYRHAGFTVAYNWPYKGGRVTEIYGRPAEGCHSLQIELNRALYMDEATKQARRELWANLQTRLGTAVSQIYASLPPA